MGLLNRSSAVETDEGAPSSGPDISLLTPSSAAFPRVDLTPGVIAEEAKVRRGKLVLVGAAAVSVGVVGALYMMAGQEVAAAEERLDAANARSAVLATQLAEYADVPKARAELAQAQSQQYTAMGGEVRWSFLLNDLALTMPRGASLTEFKGVIDGVAPAAGAATAAAGAADSANVSVLGKPAIGTISYAGEARAYSNVATFLDTLAKQKTLLDPFPGTVQEATDSESGTSDGTTTNQGQGYEFTASAAITSKALSHRYDIKDGG
ncbi:MAG: PilN domain-containing protein [Candidatus Nanopelagicales bacterium]|jgi:Tfp pilus assembly protein PilN